MQVGRVRGDKRAKEPKNQSWVIEHVEYELADTHSVELGGERIVARRSSTQKLPIIGDELMSTRRSLPLRNLLQRPIN